MFHSVVVYATSKKLVGAFWPVKASIWRSSCFVFLCNLGLFVEYHFKIEKESRTSRGTKSHLAERERRRQPVGQETAVERHCRRYHRLRALPIAPVYNEPPTARVRGLRYQSNSRRETSLEFGGEQHGYSKIPCQKRAETSSARSTAPGKDRWYVKYSTTGRGAGRERCEEAPVRKEPAAEGTQGASSKHQPRKAGRA